MFKFDQFDSFHYLNGISFSPCLSDYKKPGFTATLSARLETFPGTSQQGSGQEPPLGTVPIPTCGRTGRLLGEPIRSKQHVSKGISVTAVEGA